MSVNLNDNSRGGCLLLFVLLVLLGAFAATAIEQAFEIRSRDILLEDCHKTIRQLGEALGKAAVMPTPSATPEQESNVPVWNPNYIEMESI